VLFLHIGKPEHSTLDEYYCVRTNLLGAYAAAMKYDHPALAEVIGVGLPPGAVKPNLVSRSFTAISPIGQMRMRGKF
jgi:hypothetical protein